MRKRPRALGWHWDAKEPYIHPENGRKSCRWCRGVVKPPKSSFCSPGCVAQWRLRTRPAEFRQAVFDRDKGVCFACKLDTSLMDPTWINREIRLRQVWHRTKEAVRFTLDPAPLLAPDGQPYPLEFWTTKLTEAHVWYEQHNIPLSESPWQVHHLIAVSDGGDWYSMDNVVTACVPCHRQITAAYNRERARLKRNAKKDNRRIFR